MLITHWLELLIANARERFPEPTSSKRYVDLTKICNVLAGDVLVIPTWHFPNDRFASFLPPQTMLLSGCFLTQADLAGPAPKRVHSLLANFFTF
jgi:hypothetical protein